MTKVIAWDFDGPINDPNPSINSEQEAFVYTSTSQHIAWGEGRFPYDIYISNVPYLKLTLDLLQANGIISVLASQRLQIKTSYKAIYAEDMYNALDQLLGADRPYLRRTLANSISRLYQDMKINETKEKLLEVYYEHFSILNIVDKRSDIILVDDNEKYRITAANSFQFVHAPRKHTHDFCKDNAYLIEILLRAVPFDKLCDLLDAYQTIYSLKPERYLTGTVIKTFKENLLKYKINHAEQVQRWQNALLGEQPQPSKQVVKKPLRKAAPKKIKKRAVKVRDVYSKNKVINRKASISNFSRVQNGY